MPVVAERWGQGANHAYVVGIFALRSTASRYTPTGGSGHMPIMVNLTTAEHGGKVAACGTHGDCGANCTCGCPYTGMEARGLVEPIHLVEQRYPNEWLAFVLPPGEDEYAPERGMLVVHSHDDAEVFEAVTRITHNQVVHVYYNGQLDAYLTWADAA